MMAVAVPGGFRRRQARGKSGMPRWALAFVLTLLVHVLLLWAGRFIHPLAGEAPAQAESKVLEVVFERGTNEPTQFTELPEDRAEESPESAKLLSNVDSRARDLTGGEGDQPRQEGLTDFPQVRLEEGAIPSSPQEANPVEESLAQAEREAESPEELDLQAELEVLPGTSLQEVSARTSLLGQRAEAQDPFAASRRSVASVPQAAGNYDLFQDATNSPEREALLGEDFSLSTTAWDFAPWVLDFRRRLTENWVAPMGYHLGLISGWTLVEVEITMAGEVVRMEVLDEAGHQAFRSASVGALDRAQPLLPLPEDFPDPTLILQIRLSYPEHVRRAQGVRRPSSSRLGRR